jgi:adenine-specific methyltransferase EcoRI-like protein
VSRPNDGSKNRHLGAAKAAKNDEFYTQWADVEREMNAYLEYDPDVFRDKVVLLPCDDPEWSNFTKFFALHFGNFGLKKLISTSYAPDSNPAKVNYQPTLFELESPAFDATKTHANGKKFTLEAKDINDDGVIDIDDLQWEYLDGDGDFRSQEVTALRDEADFVITNPPFSLFRPFMTWVVGADGSFR